MLFEVGVTDYADQLILIKRALSHLETRCGVPGTSMLGQPVSRFGWTFFQIAMKRVLVDRIEETFGDMIAQYREGKPEERLARFMSDFLESRGCKIRLKLAQ